MFFPYGTDAPVYYWPFTTVAMIIANVLVFTLEVCDERFADALVLETGSGIHPLQWLTTNFAHAGPMHLAGNMLFLWAFGLIVEGKLGWLKTLVAYLGIGVVYGADRADTHALRVARTSAGGFGGCLRIHGHEPDLVAGEFAQVRPVVGFLLLSL